MLPDPTLFAAPLACIGPAQILPAHKRVQFLDGSECNVHHVLHAHSMEPHLAIRLPSGGGAWLVFPVHALLPELAADMRRLPAEDLPGLLYYSLRWSYPSAVDLFKAVLHQQASAAVAQHQQREAA